MDKLELGKLTPGIIFTFQAEKWLTGTSPSFMNQTAEIDKFRIEQCLVLSCFKCKSPLIEKAPCFCTCFDEITVKGNIGILEYS